MTLARMFIECAKSIFRVHPVCMLKLLLRKCQKQTKRQKYKSFTHTRMNKQTSVLHVFIEKKEINFSPPF